MILKILLLLLFALPILFGCENDNDKTEDNGDVNIPDTNFKAYLITNSAINSNGDDEIQVSEARAFNGTINCSNKEIFNLKGIEVFTALTYLDCSNNHFQALDVSGASALTYLDCSSNQLTSLNISGASALTYLDCNSNRLTSLDISKNKALTKFDCSSNQLLTLNISGATALTDLNCGSNRLASLDVSKNTALTKLECEGNKFDCVNLR